MASSIFDRLSSKTPEDSKIFVSKNLDISEQILAILEKKGWTQKDLARALDKQESEVSKWLSGLHNLTLKTIAKMEAVLGEDIIITPNKAQGKFVELREAESNFTASIKVSFPSLSNKNVFDFCMFRPNYINPLRHNILPPLNIDKRHQNMIMDAEKKHMEWVDKKNKETAEEVSQAFSKYLTSVYFGTCSKDTGSSLVSNSFYEKDSYYINYKLGSHTEPDIVFESSDNSSVDPIVAS